MGEDSGRREKTVYLFEGEEGKKRRQERREKMEGRQGGCREASASLRAKGECEPVNKHSRREDFPRMGVL